MRLRFVEGFGASADLDASWPPRRQHLVDDDRGAPGAGDVAELLGGGEAVPGDLDGLAVGPQRPPDRGDVRRPVRTDGRDPGQPPLALQVGQLGVGEHANDRPRFDDVQDRNGISMAPTARCIRASRARSRRRQPYRTGARPARYEQRRHRDHGPGRAGACGDPFQHREQSHPTSEATAPMMITFAAEVSRDRCEANAGPHVGAEPQRGHEPDDQRSQHGCPTSRMGHRLRTNVDRVDMANTPLRFRSMPTIPARTRAHQLAVLEPAGAPADAASTSLIMFRCLRLMYPKSAVIFTGALRPPAWHRAAAESANPAPRVRASDQGG